MKRLLMLMVLVGLIAGLCACGATVQQSVKAPAPGGGEAVQSDFGEHLEYSAYQNDAWIQDTPFGY